MRLIKKSFLICLFLLLSLAHLLAQEECTTAVVSGNAAVDGRPLLWKNLELWVGASFFSKKGELSFTGEETKVRIIPIGGGVKYISSVGGINYYSGIGINYYLYKETNPIGDASKGGFGILGMIGSFMKVTRGLIIDLYIDYSYCKMKPADYRINIGGFEAGIGIGYEF
jgi:hypothetical protein